MTEKYHHVMIDIEALGITTNAPVWAIGACFFDPKQKKLGPEFYDTISLKSSMSHGMQPDADTIMFWLAQTDDARKEIIAATNKLPTVLRLLTCFLAEHSNSMRHLRVWANGPTYDITILENSFCKCGIEIPWNFYNLRCVRTAVEFGRWDNFNPKEDMPFEGIKHNAAADSRHQARYVSEIVSRLFLTGSDDDLKTQAIRVEYRRMESQYKKNLGDEASSQEGAQK